MARVAVTTADGQVINVDVGEDGTTSFASATSPPPAAPAAPAAAPAEDGGFLSSLMSSLLSPQNVGGTIGAGVGFAGGTIGGFGVGGLPGAAGGAALGSGAGEAAQQLYDFLSSGQTKASSFEAAKDIGLEGLIGGGSELVGGKVLSNLNPFGSQTGKDLLGMAKRQGVPLTAGQATDSFALQGIEKSQQNLFGSGARMRQFAEDQRAAVAKRLEQIRGQLGLEKSAAEVGEIAESGVTLARKQKIAEKNRIFKAIETMAGPDAIVSSQNMKSVLSDIMANRPASKLLQTEIEGAGFVDKLVKEMPDSMPYAEAQKWRLFLGDVASGDTALEGLNATQAYKLKAAITDDINDVNGGAVGQALKDANDWYKSNLAKFNPAKGEFRAGILSDLVGSHPSPDEVAKKLIRGKDVTRVKAIREVFPSGSVEDGIIQRHVLEQMLANSLDPAGDFSARNFRTRIKTMGDNTLRELWGKEGFNNILEFTKVAEMAQSKKGNLLSAGTGPVGLLGQLYVFYTSPIGGTALVAGNWGLSKALLSPTMAKLLTQQIKPSPAVQRAGGVALRSVFSGLSADPERRTNYGTGFTRP